MSWFRRDSPLRTSFSRKFSPAKIDASTCFEAFKGHWNQAWLIIEKNGNVHSGTAFTIDNVTAVVNNLDQMVTLLLQETSSTCAPNSSQGQGSQWAMGPILDYVLTEGILDKLFTWSLASGEFMNVMKLEQLKIYEVLVSHSHHNLLFQKPVIRPLLQLLNECRECSPVEVEKRLIVLLNTLCVCLSQHPQLLEVFFSASSEQEPASDEVEKALRFLIFSLLIPFVHREGAIGQQARDALLLCMALSRKNENIGLFIAEHSNFCPVLATGLSGLYSVLPRKLIVVSDDWHHFTPEDIQDMPELEMFLNSLEFCNAVIQVAHLSVREQLLDYIYQGFLVPVLGPALNQTSLEEVVATTAYLELSLRSVTEPTLILLFLRFILSHSYEDVRILDTLVRRLELQSKLALVTMSLFRTLLDLNCEDVLLELVLKYLIPCSHVMVSQRCRVRDLDIYCQTAEKLLSLIPNCCLSETANDISHNSSLSSGVYSADWNDFYERVPSNGSLRIKKHHRNSSTSSFTFGDNSNLNSQRLFGGGTNSLIGHQAAAHETLQSSYTNYLKSAHRMLLSCNFACKCWSAPYDGLNPDSNEGSMRIESGGSRVASISSNFATDSYDKQNGDVFLNGLLLPGFLASGLRNSPSVGSPDSGETMSRSFGSVGSSGVSDCEEKEFLKSVESENRDLIPPLIKAGSSEDGVTFGGFRVPSRAPSNTSNDSFGSPDIGPFLSALFSRLECMMQNDVYTNLQLTGLLTRLAVYPQPLVRSFLLNHSLVFQPSVRSLIQVLTTLKQKLDSFSYSVDNFESMLVKAKHFLAAREERLLKNGPPRVYAEAHSRRSNSTDFQRADSRRRSFTSFIFRRGNSVMEEPLVETMPDSQGYRYVSKPSPTSCEGKIEYIKTRNAALCAVIFEEFLKELAAVTQEHAVIQADPEFFNFELRN